MELNNPMTTLITEPVCAPVLFLIFQRPDTTARVFERIRAARPSRLFVAADGPRHDRSGEHERCAAARKIIDDGVDWPCEVQKLYRDENLGCRRAVAGAIDWFFEQVPEGIILEDDTLPHPDFFPYCTTLLERYREDPKVMHIGGSNFIGPHRLKQSSYWFSQYNHIWGWACWRNAWSSYNDDLSTWFSLSESDRARRFGSRGEYQYWNSLFLGLHENGHCDTWDYRWSATCWMANGLSVYPQQNLVFNIGFGDGSTHTIVEAEQLPTKSIMPLKHPRKIKKSTLCDLVNAATHFGLNSRMTSLAMGIWSRFIKTQSK